MAYLTTGTNPSPIISAKAGNEIAGGAFTAVEFNTDGDVITAAGTNAPVGILAADNDDVQKGDVVSVQVSAIGYWRAGAAFNAGDLLTADAEGDAIKATAGKFILGVALEEATGKGTVVSVQITKSGYAV